MKTKHLTSIFVLAFLTSALLGCASNNQWQGDSAPFPTSTPFDSDQLARNAYLEGFRSGYRAQMAGTTLGVQLEGGPYLHARRLGFDAGAAHARAQSPESAPATRINQAR